MEWFGVGLCCCRYCWRREVEARHRNVRHVHHLEQHLGLLAEGARRLREDSDVIARDGLFHRLDSLRRRDRRLDLGLGGGVGGHLGALHEGPDLLDDLIRLHPAHNPVHLLPLLECGGGGGGDG